MLRIICVLSLIVLGFTGCKKDNTCSFDPCSIVAPASEIQAVQNYLTTNNITATQHCSGMFYQIVSQGSDKTATFCNSANATYVGKLANGSTFDQGTIDFDVSGVIRGWQNGLTLIQQGGRIRLYIPPTLGYGGSQVGTIPPNSILIFDLTLNRVY
jgi:FKBP-type peptidyl-prolyl cis-trans isomerase FkpA